MATLIASLALSGSRLADGTPNSGGLCFLVRPGTANTAVIGYTSRDATAALPTVGGGIVLDPAGKQAIFIQEPAVCRIEDSTGVTIDSFTAEVSTSAEIVEVINAGYTGINPDTLAVEAGRRTFLGAVLTSLAASCGGLDGQYSAGGTGAVQRTIQAKFSESQVSVKDFGAIGNGIADDTAACQNAINAVAGAGGGVVYFPPGTYLTSAALVTTVSMILRGASAATTGIPVSFIKATSSTQNGITNSTYLTVEGLGIRQSATSSGSAMAFVAAPSIIQLKNVAIAAGFANGISGFGIIYGYDSVVTGSSAAVAATSGPVFLGNCNLSSAGNAISATNAGTSLVVLGGTISAGAIVTSALTTVLVGVAAPSSTLTINSAATSFSIVGGSIAGITDNRVGAPVAYSIGTTGAITPLPLQSDIVRINATAAITVTVANAAPTGFGRRWTLHCMNTSGGSVTWAFGTKYKLNTTVGPSTGNRTSLTLEYDPILDTFVEVSRQTTPN